MVEEYRLKHNKLLEEEEHGPSEFHSLFAKYIIRASLYVWMMLRKDFEEPRMRLAAGGEAVAVFM